MASVDSTLTQNFYRRLAEMPIIAILRGVRPQEVEDIGEAIFATGITLIEVPLNSPNAFQSIERLSIRFAGRALVGAGTVLSIGEVRHCHDNGSQLILSPNMRPEVIAASVSAGMISVPGCLTPTEAFAALDAGAHAIKLFPGDLLSPVAVKAMRAVLPRSATVLVVGGVTANSVDAYKKVGVNGFGVGTAIYRSGSSAQEVASKAAAFAAAFP